MKIIWTATMIDAKDNKYYDGGGKRVDDGGGRRNGDQLLSFVFIDSWVICRYRSCNMQWCVNNFREDIEGNISNL
jgi:hypothetical protein